jgi:hypothetical protein
MQFSVGAHELPGAEEEVELMCLRRCAWRGGDGGKTDQPEGGGSEESQKHCHRVARNRLHL